MKVINPIDLAADKYSHKHRSFTENTLSPARIILALVAGIMLGAATVPPVFAAQGGNGNGGGGNGNSGSGPDKGDLYGDAVYLLRNPDTGVPVLINGCIRPLSAPGGSVLALNADYPDGDYEPEEDPANIENWFDCEPANVEAAKAAAPDVILADEDPDAELEACDVISRCTDYVTEADMGRLSMLRAPERVLDRQLDEAISKFESGGEITLDASGRPVVGGVTFDSPLLNLAMYRELHLWGAIVKDPLGKNEEIVYEPDDFVLAAAFGLGGGDDKEDPGIDNEIAVRSAAIIGLGEMIHELSLNGDAVMPDSYEFKYEGKTRYFVNYSGFTYSRLNTFPGNICYDYFDVGQGRYVRAFGPIIDVVFEGDADMYPVAEELTGFSLAANDARRVLVFVHDNLVQAVDSVFENIVAEADCPPLD